jgi:hypothetical protein
MYPTGIYILELMAVNFRSYRFINLKFLTDFVLDIHSLGISRTLFLQVRSSAFCNLVKVI